MIQNKLLNRKKINPSEAIFTGMQMEEQMRVQLFSYNEKQYTEDENYSIESFKGFQDQGRFYWLNIHGIHEVKKIKDFCSKLNIHDLAIQDLLDVNQRPKFQEYSTYWFFTLKSVIPSQDETLALEQLSFILGSNYLISFQERKADYFEHIRERLRKNMGIVRERGADYLLYLLLEAILDNYFRTIADIGNKLEEIDIVEFESDPSPALVKSIERYKRQVHQIKTTIIPIKDFVLRIEREKFSFIHEKQVKYFYELRDLCLSLIDECAQIEVMLESNTNLFFSLQGHRMNQVMKTLTVVATIFIPLTFVAGIYGMNFTNMPELQWKYGYFGIWVVMVAIFILMMMYFRRKKWF